MQREACPGYKGLDNAWMKKLHVPGARQGQQVCEGNLSLIQHLPSASYTAADWKPSGLPEDRSDTTAPPIQPQGII